jgi:hypothetical protein
MLNQIKLPSTTVQPERSKSEMIEILKKFGINDYQWTEYKGEVKLEFEVEINFDNKPTPMHAVLRPPELKELRKVWDAKAGKTVKKNVLNWPVAYRVMRNYLRERLLMVSSGAYPFEDIFLADLVLEHPLTHEKVRFVDYLRHQGQIPGLALPYNPEADQPVQETKSEPTTEVQH